MKKTLAAIAALMLAVLAIFAAQAEDLPRISFAEEQIRAQSGDTVQLVLTADAAPAQNVDITIADGRGNKFSVVLPQGETQAVLEVSGERAAYNKQYEYTIQASDSYRRGTVRRAQVVFKGVPMAKFSREMLQTYMGETLKIGFQMKGPQTLEKGQMIYLRDEQGQTVAEVAYTGREYYSVSLKMTADWRPMKTLTLHIGEDGPADSSLMVFVGDKSELSIVGVRRDDNKISFTLDCGSTMQYASTVLDTLDRYNVKITFFVTGNFAVSHPDIVREFVARGHEIGNHSYHHPHLLDADLDTIWEEVTSASDLLEEITGVRPVLYRPPYGDSHGRVRAVVEGAGMRVIRWSHTLYDSDEAKQITGRSYYFATKDITGGSIILGHLDSKATVEALPDILQWYQDNGFEVVPVSELLLQGDTTVDSEGYQIYRQTAE